YSRSYHPDHILSQWWPLEPKGKRGPLFGGPMKFKALFAAACLAIPAVFGCGAHAAYAQARGAQPAATDTEATAIPGVVAAGAKVHVIKDGFSGSEGTI